MHGISVYFVNKQKQCVFEEIKHPSLVSSPLRCAWSPPNHRFLTAGVECWSVETSRLLSEETSFDCGAKGQLLTLKDINTLYPICFTNKHIARERGSTQRADKQPHCTTEWTQRSGKLISINKPVISWRSLRTCNQLWKLTRLSAIWAVLRTTVIVTKACKGVKMGNSLK